MPPTICLSNAQTGSASHVLAHYSRGRTGVKLDSSLALGYNLCVSRGEGVHDWLYIAGAALMAGLLQGLTGLGSSILLVSLLVLRGEALVHSSVVASFMCLAVQAVIMYRLHRHLMMPSMWALVGAMAVGVPLGLWMLTAFGAADWMQRVFGGFVVAVALWLLFAPERPHTASGPQHLLGAGAGLVSGLACGLFNTGGPPAALYVYSRPIPFDAAKVAVQWLFTGMVVYRVALLLAQGIVTKEATLQGVFAAPLAGVGTFVGLKLAEHVHPERLRMAVYVLLVLIGLRLCVWP